MTAASPVAEFWTLDKQIGRLQRGAVSGQVDLARPQLGLHGIRVETGALAGHLLGVGPSDLAAPWPASVADAYVRGQDLVATYAAGDDWPYAPQIYWRVDADSPSNGLLAALSLVVSIQTNLLDTHPRFDVRSQLPATEVLRVGLVGEDVCVESPIDGEQSIDPRSSACGLVWRLPGGRLSYAEIMPASDFRQLAIRREPSGEYQSRWELFAEFLEKGVIRRARLQSILLPRENDVQFVAECCRAIEKRPLPLTT